MEISYYLYGVVFLATAIATMYVAHRGYWSDPKGRKNKLFLFLSLAMIIWLLGEAGFWFSSEMKMVLAFYHFKYIGIILTPSAFFFVANAVPIWRNILNKKWVYYVLLSFAAGFVTLCVTNPLTNIFFSSYYEAPLAPGKYYGEWSAIWWGYTLCAYSIILAGIISFLISIKQAKTKIERNQARVLVFAAIIPFVGNVINLLTPTFIDPTPFAMSFSTILLGYAISKYKLFSITPETERMDGVKEKIPFKVEHGYNYVIVDDHTNAPYFLLRALSTQKPGL
ncbi:MAG: hypothetical protein N3F63_01765, partial [Thermoplasmata archaeon]|nr:hypothetical protein [Thermoplasmata archaeon]